MTCTESCFVASDDQVVTKASPPLPRFNLRKRSVSSERDNKPIATFNSAFLSGLFADVARVEAHDAPADSHHDEARFDCSKPVKKSRISLTKSMSRCGRSFKSLSQAVVSPCGVGAIFGEDLAPSKIHPTPPSSEMLQRHDSLHYQLNCVSSSSSNESDGVFSKTVIDAAKLAFPQLPATVSNPSCSLTRIVSDQQLSGIETSQKESYGWFVELDGDHSAGKNAADPYAANATSDLAFSAPTAPKAYNNDAEVEWAKAADTVDDVLGDFF